MKKALAPFALLLFLLTGCLEDETPCSYFVTTLSTLTTGEWQVDTFHVVITDTVSGYSRDTTYINDGTIRFTSTIYDCDYDNPVISGAMLFARKDGNLYNMTYSFESDVPWSFSYIRIACAAPLDGFNKPYNIRTWNRIQENKIQITMATPYGGYYPYWVVNPGLSYVRYWEFTLSKN